MISSERAEGGHLRYDFQKLDKGDKGGAFLEIIEVIS